jgi:hypothetical protein
MGERRISNLNFLDLVLRTLPHLIFQCFLLILNFGFPLKSKA